MKILDRHLRWALLGMCVIVALALTGISGFVTLVEELDDLGQGQYNLAKVGLVTLLKLPELLYEMFPLIVLLSAILGLGALAAGGELVVMQAAGVSVLRMAWSAGKTGLLLGVVVLLLGEFLVPWAKQQADTIESVARYGEQRSRGNTVWLRQGDWFIRLDTQSNDASAKNVQALHVSRDNHRLLSTQAMDTVRYQDGQWQADNLRMTQIADDQVEVSQSPQGEWAVDLDPDVLELFVLKSEGLSLRGLYEYIQYLQSNGLDDTSPQYALWRKLSAPLTVLVMVLLAVPFVLGPLRDTGAGERLFIGVMIGIGFYVLNEVAGSLGQVYHWPAPLSALSPTILLGLIALYRLHRAAFR